MISLNINQVQTNTKVNLYFTSFATEDGIGGLQAWPNGSMKTRVQNTMEVLDWHLEELNIKISSKRTDLYLKIHHLQILARFHLNSLLVTIQDPNNN